MSSKPLKNLISVISKMNIKTRDTTLHPLGWSHTHTHTHTHTGFRGGSAVKNLPANPRAAGDTGLIPGSGRSPGEGYGNPLQYSCLENPMDRGAWRAMV